MKFTNEEKDKIAKQFVKQMKGDYPNVSIERVKRYINNWENGKESEDIIEMFLFPELDKLWRYKSG